MQSDEHPASQEMTTKIELEHALEIAEKLLYRTERTSERCRIMRSAEAGVVGLALFAITGWVGLDRYAGWERLTSVSLIGVVISFSVATVIYLVLEVPLRKRIARDARAVVEMVGLVRDLMPLVARHEKWNELQRNLFRSRLSRFPIGQVGIR